MKLKNIFKNKWYILSFSIAFLGLICLILYAQTRSFIFAALFLILASIGLFGYYKGKKEPDKGATVTRIPPTTGDINCLKIYSGIKDGVPYADKITFEYVQENNLIGNRWYFEDIGLWLNVMYNDIKNPDEWKEFDLPDEKYNHPGKLAWVLNQDDYEDFMRLEPTMFEKLKPLLILGANALVLFFIFLVTSEGGNG